MESGLSPWGDRLGPPPPAIGAPMGRPPMELPPVLGAPTAIGAPTRARGSLPPTHNWGSHPQLGLPPAIRAHRYPLTRLPPMLGAPTHKQGSHPCLGFPLVGLPPTLGAPTHNQGSQAPSHGAPTFELGSHPATHRSPTHIRGSHLCSGVPPAIRAPTHVAPTHTRGSHSWGSHPQTGLPRTHPQGSYPCSRLPPSHPRGSHLCSGLPLMGLPPPAAHAAPGTRPDETGGRIPFLPPFHQPSAPRSPPRFSPAPWPPQDLAPKRSPRAGGDARGAANSGQCSDGDGAPRPAASCPDGAAMCTLPHRVCARRWLT